MWNSIAPPRVQRLKLSDWRSEEQFELNIFSRNIMRKKSQQLTSSKISDGDEINFRQRIRNAEVLFVER